MLSIAAPILLALVSILAAARRAQGALVPALLSQNVLRAVLPSVACLLYVQVAPLTLSATIWIYALGLVLCLPLAWPRLPAAQPYPLDRKALAGLSASQAGWMVFTHLDVLIVATVASAAEAALYLVARRLAGLLPLLFDALRSALAPGLSVAYHRKEGFGGLAARTNLGFFLIGGGAATALAVLGPLALAGFGPDFTAASGLLIWLTLGQAAPALFGATGMLMTMTDMERPRAVLVWIALPLGAGALLFSAQHSLLALAIATAVMHLLFAAICAACLARRHGILPGLTALLHPKLRFKA